MPKLLEGVRLDAEISSVTMGESAATHHASHPSPQLDAWLREKSEVQRESGQSCHGTRRCESPSGDRPTSDATHVCPQQRLYSAYMFTDDLVWIVVWVDRTLRALREWRRLADELGLLTAIPEKQTFPRIVGQTVGRPTLNRY